MADPVTLSLATLGGSILTEGVKFLYTQAGELLKYYRERRQSTPSAGNATGLSSDRLQVQIPSDVFETPIEKGADPPSVDLGALDKCAEQLRGLWSDLAPFATEIDEIDHENGDLLARMDALRQIFEIVYHRPFTFKGEKRSIDPLTVGGTVHADTVAGYAAAVRARSLHSGAVSGNATARQVEAGGRLIGVDIDTIGDSAS